MFFIYIISGCPKGKYGKSCLKNCTCENGATCNQKNGKCACPPGFTGKSCEKSRSLMFVQRCCSHDLSISFNPLMLFFSIECPSDKYGLDCKSQCNCENGATCDRINGACHCSAGWSGPKCSQRNHSYCFFSLLDIIVKLF